MYSENVDIWVDGKKITICVPCEPSTPKEVLKKIAIDIYLDKLRSKLIKVNLK